MNGRLITVIREDLPQHIHENDLRKGDFVLIQTGDLVPADLKLIEVRSLEVDEFDITGELMPVSKHVSSEDGFLYMGSRIIHGSAKGMVIASGHETEYGQILTQPFTNFQPPKLQFFQKKHLGFLILLLPAFIISIIQSPHKITTALLFLLAGGLSLLLQNDPLFQLFLLNHEKHKEEKKNISIRNPDIFLKLSEIDVICFDKTGVLTTRYIEIVKIFLYSSLVELAASFPNFGSAIPALVKTACALSTDISYYEKLDSGNPVDCALISFAQRMGVDLENIHKKYRRFYDQPFDSEKRYMSCGYETEDQGKCYFMKGDPDIVISKCKKYYSENGHEKKLDFHFQSKIRALSHSISQKGGIAIAMAIAAGNVDPDQPEYTFLCLVQLENTLQNGAKDVIQKIIGKGIRPLLLTGDQPEAALKIARDCGVARNTTVSLSGKVMDRMALDELGRQSEYCSVFSRLKPSQKGSIIRQLRNKGHRVMMVGDGPNDGIALKAADIGISFQSDSSPIAMRLSSIWINQLTDIADLIEDSTSLVRRLRYLKYFRIFILILFMICAYIYAYPW